MTNEEAKQLKAQCLADIRQAMMKPCYYDVTRIDHRISDYIYDCIRTDIDAVNLYELLAVRKFLRMWRTYPFDIKKVQQIYTAYEHLLFNGMKGRTKYRLTPLQTFQLAAPFGFQSISDTARKRVCTEANYFIPRKSSKTTLAAFFNFWFFLFEDFNAECYCVANSQDQSKILFDLTKDFIQQMDPQGKRIRITATEITWYNHSFRNSKVSALSAGGKTKDGLFAQLCCADEYGSAGYVKNKSDMANLVNVVEGSMGPRREPMTVITTTAGRVQEGPYEIKLRGIKQSLLGEMSVPLDKQPHALPTDWQFALICCPDQWEEDEESLQHPELWRKVNRHLGITVQEDFYKREWDKMRLDPEKKREQITKLFNVWQSGRVRQWLTAADIQPLQVPTRIDDLRAEDGWLCFVGCDFSKVDDLTAMSYLCYNSNTGEFFADMDAWIPSATLAGRQDIFTTFHDKGFLHVVEGAVMTKEPILARLQQIADAVTICAIGYDAYDSRLYINDISAWIFSIGGDPQQYLRPVGQNYATYNAAVQEMTYMIKQPDPLIRFCANPMYGWEFGNCMLAESQDGMDNVKPVKATNSGTCKVDNVQALLSALVLYDQASASVRC